MTTGNTTTTSGGLIPELACGGSPLYYPYKRVKTWSGANQVGDPPLDNHSYTMSLTEDEMGVVRRISTGQTGSWNNCFGALQMGAATVWDANEENKLLAKLAEKIKGHDFDASLFLGTQHQTFSLITNRARRIRAGLTELVELRDPRRVLAALASGNVSKRGRRKLKEGEKVNLVQDLSQLWLECQYGWLPLLSDVHDGAEALAASADRSLYRTRFKSSRTKSVSGTLTVTPKVYSQKSSARRTYIYYVEPATTYTQAFAMSGLTNPLGLAWELVPWSFVVDWFVPVGTFLGNLSFFPHLKGSWVRSTKTDRRSSGTLQYAGTPSFAQVTPCKKRVISFERTVGSTALSVPRPNFKSPISEDYRRALNAVSLVGARIPRS